MDNGEMVSSGGFADLSGTGYGRKPAQHDAFLTEVGPGTPCGEYMRRFWLPVAVAGDVVAKPRNLRVLGEDLVIFRNGSGQVGLLHQRCAHRGTSLYYGRIENEGIRCCYHGWLYDVEGRCLEQPLEPDCGRFRDRVRQPWYPVKEHYGLVWGYFGPPDKMPFLPRFDFLEDFDPEHKIFAQNTTKQSGWLDDAVEDDTVPYNWLQYYENNADLGHIWALHVPPQFPDTEGFRTIPKLEFDAEDNGVVSHLIANAGGNVMDLKTHVVLPNMFAIPDEVLAIETESGTTAVNLFTPVDDTHFLAFIINVGPSQDLQAAGIPVTPDLRTWSQMTDEEHRDYPSDFEAQMSQGAIACHSEEHLVKSDQGIIILRQRLRKQINAVLDGGDPLGVAFDEDSALIRFNAGTQRRADATEAARQPAE